MMDWLLLIASLLVAGGTLALAIATFRMIQKTEARDKRNEKIRVLPFISLNREFEKASLEYVFAIKNIGRGPALSIEVCAILNEKRHPYKNLPRELMIGESLLFTLALTHVKEEEEIEIEIKFQDILGNSFTLSYAWNPVLNSQPTIKKRSMVLL